MGRLDLLQGLLRAPLRVTAAKRQKFPAGWKTPDGIVVTHRFLIILAGAIDYTVEGRKRRLAAGVQFFVPAWCRREWTVPRRGGACRLLWVELSSGEMEVSPELVWRKPADLRRERATLDTIYQLVNTDDGGRGERLRVEGELKAMLARFWCEAETGGARPARNATMHPEVGRAVAWLERHFAEADALERFYETVALSPNHFRLLFKRQTGETVQAVLARLRLRRARYLVQETSRPLKQIAAETGHADPLYFSMQYRRFWGLPPSADRQAAGLA